MCNQLLAIFVGLAAGNLISSESNVDGLGEPDGNDIWLVPRDQTVLEVQSFCDASVF